MISKEEIIKIAKQAGIYTDNFLQSAIVGESQLERFACLVAAHEREECAKVCDEMILYTAFDCAASIRARNQA